MYVFNPQKYYLNQVISFSDPNETWGDLSNLSAVYPVVLNGRVWESIESLYHALGFSQFPEVQQQIFSSGKGLKAKEIKNRWKKKRRPDWQDIKVYVMEYCVILKMSLHKSKFENILYQTKKKPLVEVSKDDSFWAAIPDRSISLNSDLACSDYQNLTATGVNMVGQVLMKVRELLFQTNKKKQIFPPVSDLKLFDQVVPNLYL